MQLHVIFETPRDGEIYADVTEIPHMYTLTPHFFSERLQWIFKQPVTIHHMEYTDGRL